MYIKKIQIKRMYLKETDKRIDDKVLTELKTNITDYALKIIKKSIWLAEITEKKTLMPFHLQKTMDTMNLPYNEHEIYNELNKSSIKRLVKENYQDRVSENYIKALINQLEFFLQNIIRKTIKISNLNARRTVKSKDLRLYNKYKNQF